jgi:hypothetical protein
LDHDNMFHDVNLEQDYVNSWIQQVESWLFIVCQCWIHYNSTSIDKNGRT